ncbi:Inorganic pyrophosphatase [Sesbania bispinosa]|nr:Inorganic pyrophosphatase [Sesbania bispinosa]
MATTRAIAIAIASNSTCTLLTKKPFLGSHSLCLKNLKVSRTSRSFTCKAIYNPQVSVKEEGQPQTLDYRAFFVDQSGKKVSPWHDIPLQLGDGVFNFIVEIPKESSAKMEVSPWHDIPLQLGGGVFNFIVEIPKESSAKMEVATDEPFTPIKQDTKKGKLRFYPYNIHWNYGLLPQTWEDPSLATAEVEGAFGDNDPVDVVEIGESQRKIGDVLRVKPLAALAMIDEGELDWKIVAISLDDPKASLVNDVDDVEKHFPGTLTAIRDWFRDYKIPDGKPANKFGLGNQAANKILVALISMRVRAMGECFRISGLQVI